MQAGTSPLVAAQCWQGAPAILGVQSGYNRCMNTWLLAGGDVVALALVTLAGFSRHGELSGAFLPRMAAALLPLCVGWFLLAPPLGLFDAQKRPSVSQLWLPGFIMFFVGPLAGVVRGIVLGVPVIPSFVVVLSATSAVALVIWRALYLLVIGRRAAEHAG